MRQQAFFLTIVDEYLFCATCRVFGSEKCFEMAFLDLIRDYTSTHGFRYGIFGHLFIYPTPKIF